MGGQVQRDVARASGVLRPPLPFGAAPLLGLLVPFAGACLQWLLWNILRPYAFLFFYPVLLISFQLGGYNIGRLAGLISVLLIWYCFVPTEMSFAIEPRALIALTLNAMMGAVFLLVLEQLRISHHALQVAHQGSEARMTGIVQSAMDAIVSVDSKQRIILFNRAAEKLFATSATEVLGSSLDVLMPARYRGLHREHLAGFALKGSTGRSMRSLGVLMALRADGQEFPIEASISQIEEGGEKIFTVILREITERLNAEAELQALEQRLRAITENLAEGLVVSDLQGNLLHWNRAALEMHQFSALADGLGQVADFQKIFCLQTLAGVELQVESWPLSQVLAGGQLRDMDLRIKRRDLSWERVFRYSGSVIQERVGHHIAYLAIADITEQYHAQEQVRQLNQELEQRVEERTAQLQAANRELEAFSYSVSHDLRSPLRAMDGFSRATLEDYGHLLPEDGREFLQTICASAARMGLLIDDLLAFSQLGRVKFKRVLVPVKELVDEIVAEAQQDFPEQLFEIRTDPMPDCSGDPALLRQVWVNLINNAFKYSRGKSPARLHIGTTLFQSQSAYFVRDNGAGFDMRYVEKLFGVFQRLHRAEDYPGTGVGLAIVQRIVHRHGGRVWAEGEVGRGACFYFTLGEAMAVVAS